MQLSIPASACACESWPSSHALQDGCRHVQRPRLSTRPWMGPQGSAGCCAPGRSPAQRNVTAVAPTKLPTQHRADITCLHTETFVGHKQGPRAFWSFHMLIIPLGAWTPSPGCLRSRSRPLHGRGMVRCAPRPSRRMAGRCKAPRHTTQSGIPAILQQPLYSSWRLLRSKRATTVS